MISIRENIFESNSSSCHSLTVCKKSLKDKLMNGEVYYYGDFEYDDCDDSYINILDETKVKTKQECFEMLTTWLNTPSPDPNVQYMQKEFKEYNVTLENFDEYFEEFNDTQNNMFTPTRLLFEYIEDERLLDLKDDVLVIDKVCITC